MLRSFILFFLVLFPLASFCGERIVSLSPALSEVVHYLGKDSELLGVTNFCDEDFCKGKERVGGIVNPNLEKIVSLKPTLVICTTMTPERFCDALERLGIKTERFRLVSIEDLFSVSELLSRELNVPSNKVKVLKRRLEEEAQGLSRCLRGKKVFIALSSKPLYCAGSSTYLGQLIEMSGGKVVPEGSFRAVSLEVLYSLKPNLVISFSGCFSFKGFKCYDLSPYKSDFLHPSPRLLRGLEKLREEMCQE